MMKLRSILLAATCLCAFNGLVSSQTQVNNSDFENWEVSTPELAEPLEWNSFKTASGSWASFGGQQLNKSTQTRPGSMGNYSAVIWCKTVLTVPANGNLTTGRINMGSTSPSNSSNYNTTLTTQTAFSEAFTGYPDSLVVWVRTKITNVAHQPRIRAVIHDNYDLRDPTDAGSAQHIVGHATLNYTTTNNVWIRKSIPFVYSGPATTPAFILVTFTTNAVPGQGTAGDSVYIDDLQFIYNPLTITTENVAPSSYFVSATQGTSITIPFILSGNFLPWNVITAQLSDANGSFTTPITLGTLTTNTSGSISGTIPAGTPTGSGYRIRVVSSNPSAVSSDNGSDIQIIKVFNSLSSSDPQQICFNSAGNEITVSEIPVGTSREWKFSTISGGSYNSFATPQTDTTYTPLFDVPGTYYVICQSLIEGLFVNSSEVVITVSSPAAYKALDIKLFLEGLYAGGGLMNQTQGQSGSQFGPDTVDLITVQLRENLPPYNVTYTFDNVSLNASGFASITNIIPITISGNYYIVIMHRNSIETWSAEPVNFGISCPVRYDFSTASSKAYGNNMKQFGSAYAIWSGDSYVDGIVDGSDMLMIDNASKPPALQGYHIEDINGDGLVDGSDMLIIDNNSKPPSIQALRP